MYKTLTTLLASNILLDFIIQAVIVEKNLYSYYLLSTTTVKTSNNSDDYFILQCPFKSSLTIPKPKDMPICLIVGRYSEKELQPEELTRAKPRSVLKTQVGYRYLKPPNFVKLMKIKNGKPYTMILKPIKAKEVMYKKPKVESNKVNKATNVKVIVLHTKQPINQSTISYSVPLIQKIQLNDSLALSSTKELQKLTQTPKPSTGGEADFLDDPLDDEDTQPGPLKYLGVQDTLTKLQSTQPHPLAANQTLYKSEKFFVDLENYKKGFRSKGFQNMYHRDEIYQDHIFYDDLQQMGKFKINQKLQQKQP